jgi:RimJ/RimL family protein N-acetyltransferase
MRYHKQVYPAGLLAPGEVIYGSKVRLREKKLSDALDDYRWQSDAELAELDAAPVLSVSYAVYLLDYANQLHLPHPSRHPLAIDTLEGRHIGNCTCYDFDEAEGQAQLGIMIGEREYRGRGYGADAINTIVGHIFSETKLERLYLKTLDWNLRAQNCFKKCGFRPCGNLSRNGQSFVLMELRREDWQKQQDTGGGL